ncbi:phosphoribosylpyrophosphate synthetase [Treponema primitia ZAS-2]|uniref:ribose-phosphate diphosphokinase n=1 Tax=Treponema primitia (strain ATCC BAA-887 / DSM 12427 / ZAS-2) TaxID=545694 RepID=F5YQX4_TREPZ|nr:ribose-phosphate diphosphokinase [Treponema primitia]AEF85076.1 phosphoribosylpyrophosphate synthetase [Treponema primitia ZAS-2]
MNYTNPANLAILACPGGEVFADEVILHLKKYYRHKYNETVGNLVRQFNLNTEDVIRHINFINDAAPLTAFARGDFLKYHNPQFKVPARFSLFPNGELKAEILESIRGKDMYIFQDVENHHPLNFNNGSLSKALSINDHLMSIFVTVDAVKQAGANRVTLVLPTYPYSRQHKRKGREGLTASRVGGILESLGVDCILTLDIHSREIVNAFKTMRLENLHASYQIIRQLAKMTELRGDDLVVLSPDTGAVDRNKFYATAFKKPLALLYKERDYSRVTKDAMDNNISEIKLLGNVSGKTVFMADDMLGTGGTLLKAMKFLKDQGAKKVIAAISLPLFSGNAIGYFDQAYKDGLFYRIIGTNAIYHEELLKREWYVSVNITKLFAQTISRLHQGLSLSSLLDNRAIIEKMLTEN